MIAIDLPGFGDSPPLSDERTINGLECAVTEFVIQHRLQGIDAVGLSLGGRLLLEMSNRTKVLGHVVALAPGGFRQGIWRHIYYVGMLTAMLLFRWLSPLLPTLIRRPRARRMLLFMFCCRPQRVPNEIAQQEFAWMARARSTSDILYDLSYRVQPQLDSSPRSQRVSIGWGLRDRISWPRQSQRALASFPNAELTWFPRAGHYLHWDLPDDLAQFILHSTRPT